MRITKIQYHLIKEEDEVNKSLATCSVVLDDCLKINYIGLFHGKVKNSVNGEEEYYLIYPSKQDVYHQIEKLNPNTEIKFPEKSNGKKYDEFYHPLVGKFYREMLNMVVEGYEYCKENDVKVYTPDYSNS